MKYKKHNAAFDKVLTALQVLSRVDFCPPDTLPPRDKWPKTRDIADYCDTNIYVSRYYLMKLVKKKKAHVSSVPDQKSLRWCIATPTRGGDLSQ